MIIREMQAGDEPALQQIYLDARISTFHWHSADEFKLEDFEESIEGETVFVAEDGDKILGFISMRNDDFIHNLFVDVSEQGRGVGKVLIQHAFDEFLVKPVSLKCTVRNTSACAFYESQGWVIEQANVAHDFDPYHLFVLR